MLLNSVLLLAAFENIGRVVVGVFAIAGGFLIGNLITYFGIKLGSKLILKKQPPAVPTRIARLVGGAALAMLVAYFVFGEGGFGFGTGAGTGHKDGIDAGKSKEVSNKNNEAPKDISKQVGPSIGNEIPRERSRVTILGGEDVKDDRYYLLDNDPMPHTLAEIKSLLYERIGKGLGGVAIYVYSNSADRRTLVVTDLEDWAREQKLELTFPPVQNQLRPRR
jgi:hypothetical protein